MGKVHPGATLTPHFRDFLPGWLARQPWYLGSGTPVLRPVGYLRLEDPAGDVGIETHLVEADGRLYQIPMTYRGTPLPDAKPDVLIATAEHSVLGTRWIYDGPADPVWVGELLRLVAENGVSEPSGKRGFGPTTARGLRLVPRLPARDRVRIELVRLVVPTVPTGDPGVVGQVVGTWHPEPDNEATETGCLALVRATDGP